MGRSLQERESLECSVGRIRFVRIVNYPDIHSRGYMLDYVDLEGDLSQEERMVRDTVRSFVEENVSPDIGEHWIEGTFPTQLITEMGDLGFYAPNLEGYGLPELSEMAYGPWTGPHWHSRIRVIPMQATHPVVVETVRTPQGKRGGVFADVRSEDLSIPIVNELLASTGLTGEHVDDLICGCARQEHEQGNNLVRVITLLSGVAGTPDEAYAQLRDLIENSVVDRPIVTIPNQTADELAEPTIEALAPEGL
jgi:hypothetical protein